MMRAKRNRMWAALAIAVVLATTALPVTAVEPAERSLDRSWIDAVELLDVVWTWIVGGEAGDLDVLDLDVVQMKDGGTCPANPPPQPPTTDIACEVEPGG